MTRTSLAEKFYDESKKVPEEPGIEWLILYDFKGIKPSTEFWTNLKRLGKMGDAGLIQYSVFLTSSKRIAATSKRLAEHYGASTMIFKGKIKEL